MKEEQEQQQQVYAHQQAEAQTLADKMNWSTPDAWNENIGKLNDYLIKHFDATQDQLNMVMDHRIYLLAEKARRFDELQNKIALSRKKVTEAHKMPTGPSAPPVSGRSRKLKEAQSIHAKNGSLDSAANVFEQLGVL